MQLWKPLGFWNASWWAENSHRYAVEAKNKLQLEALLLGNIHAICRWIQSIAKQLCICLMLRSTAWQCGCGIIFLLDSSCFGNQAAMKRVWEASGTYGNIYPGEYESSGAKKHYSSYDRLCMQCWPKGCSHAHSWGPFGCQHELCNLLFSCKPSTWQPNCS